MTNTRQPIERRHLCLSLVLWGAVWVGLPGLVWATDSAPTASLLSSAEWIEQTCSLIYEGHMQEAAERAESLDQALSGNETISSLQDILQDYRVLQKLRAEAKAEAFQKELDQLQRMKDGKHAEAPDPNEIEDPNEPIDDTFDPNDPNDLMMALSVMVRAREYASGQQRQETVC